MAIVEETTEGTVAFPTAGTDYLALQSGFSTELNFERLTNEELKASLGKSQDVVGFESPTASLSHYIRHSGTEGQAPQSGFSKLFKAVYGAEEVNATEYDTVAGSTTTVINVDVGEGVNFAIGEAVLVKHASHAWEIAVIKSISSDALTLLFALQNAPAVGTNLGKAVSYRAAEENFPTLSVHDYRGNGGAYAVVAGARVVGMTIDGSAGEFINGSFELEGIGGYFDPIEIEATDTYLDFTDDAGTHAAIITAKVYKTPIELASALQTAMQAVTTETPTVTWSNTTGKFTIANTGALFSLLWSTGANTANTVGDKIGFVITSDDTGALTYDSDTEQDWSSPQTPAFDSPGTPLVAKNNQIRLGLQSDNVCFSTRSISYELAVPKVDVLSMCAETGKEASLPNEREITVSIVANLEKHKADLFEALRNNTAVAFQWNFGNKLGNNWIAGESGCVHVKDASIVTHILSDNDGLVTLDIEVSGFVDASANSETALNLL